MEEKKLIPLKITTEYSLLKSLIKLPDLISFLNENNIKECAICDENLNGFMDFYLKCKENNIKPIYDIVNSIPVTEGNKDTIEEIKQSLENGDIGYALEKIDEYLK